MRPTLPPEIRVGQRRTLFLCWLTYTLAYTLRVNIAVVIPALLTERNYTYAQIGVVTGMFFVTYMFGQLINGYIGDVVNSKLLIISGLVLSAVCNVGMALAGSYPVTLICWSLNGLAQSMLWAPIMKTLSVWFVGSQLERVSFVMAQSMIIGYTVSWGVSALLAIHSAWTWAFHLPAAVALLYAAIMLVLFHSRPRETGSVDIKRGQPETTVEPGVRLPVRSYFRLIQLPGLLLIAMCQGLIREGIGVWFPAILQDAGRPASSLSWLILIVVQLINLAGILLVRRVTLAFRGDILRTLLLVFGLISAAATSTALLLSHRLWPALFVMAILLALTHGLTPIVTSMIPFQFARFKRVSLTAGVLDFAIYFGAALSGIISGMVADRFGWNGVAVLWLVAALTGFSVTIRRYVKNFGEKSFAQEINDPF